MPGRSALDDGLVARATDQTALIAALTGAGMRCTGGGDGTVTIDTTGGVTAEQVASVAAQSGVLLVELRAADRAPASNNSSSPSPPAATDADLEEVSR